MTRSNPAPSQKAVDIDNSDFCEMQKEVVLKMYTTEVKQLFTIFVALSFLSNIDYKIWFLNDAQSCLLMQVAIFVILIN